MPPMYFAQNGTASDIVRFGSHVKQAYFTEMNFFIPPPIRRLLDHQELSSTSKHMFSSDDEIIAAYHEHLNRGNEFYFGVRQHLMAMLQVWDAIIDEKQRFCNNGIPGGNEQFMLSFLLCVEIVSQRAKIGDLGCPSDQLMTAAVAQPTILVNGESISSQQLPFEQGSVGDEEIYGKSTNYLKDVGTEALALSDSEVSEDENNYNEDYEDDETDQEYEEHMLSLLADDGREFIEMPLTPESEAEPVSPLSLDEELNEFHQTMSLSEYEKEGMDKDASLSKGLFILEDETEDKDDSQQTSTGIKDDTAENTRPGAETQHKAGKQVVPKKRKFTETQDEGEGERRDEPCIKAKRVCQGTPRHKYPSRNRLASEY